MTREEVEKMLADFARFRDRFGLQGIASDGVNGHQTQNGVLFTAEYILAIDQESVPYVEILRAVQAILACESKVYPGLMQRHPESDELDSMDNLCALLTICILYGKIALPDRIRDHGLDVKCSGPVTDNVSPIDLKSYKWLRILKLGRQPKNFWNNRNPSKFNFYSWFGRSPGMMGLIDIAATGKTTWFRALGLFVGQFLGTFQPVENTDARKLPYVVWQALKLRGGLWAWGYKLWCKKLLKQYPNGMQDVYKIYYGPSHPLALHGTKHR